MEYYTKRVKRKRIYILLIIIFIIIIFNAALYIFDKKIFPYVMRIAEMRAKSHITQIINDNSVEILNGNFKYNEVTNIEKDNNGRIVLVQIDNAKLNYIAAKMENQCNEKLDKMSHEKIEVPLGWITEKSVFYNYGPNIQMTVQPIGNIKVTYDSKFESAGINQTRHKIYLNIKGKIRMKIPMNSEEIEINTQVPISDTIIVGEIPQMSLYSEEKN